MLSRSLEETLRRAMNLASSKKHEFATLEHLLLALIEDKEALDVLKACNVDIKNLRISLIKYIDEELKSITSATVQEAEPSASFQRVLQRTTGHIYSSNKRLISKKGKIKDSLILSQMTRAISSPLISTIGF